MDNKPSLMQPTPEQEHEATIFASGLALGELATLYKMKSGQDFPIAELDCYVRFRIHEALKECPQEGVTYERIYFETVCTLLTEDLDGFEEMTKNNELVSSFFGAGITHSAQLTNPVVVGVVPRDEEMSIPQEWIDESKGQG